MIPTTGPRMRAYRRDHFGREQIREIKQMDEIRKCSTSGERLRARVHDAINPSGEPRKRTLKLLQVNYTGGSVSGDYGESATVSGYRGHDWTKELGPDTIGIDSRPVSEGDAIVLAVSGPMVNVDLPPGTMSAPFEDGYKPFNGSPRALDFVALDVYCDLWASKGARIIRGEEEVRAFALELSKPRGWVNTGSTK